MKKLLLIAIAALSVFLYSCDELLNSASDGLSESEVVDGLKTALEVGTDTATSVLSATDGYYGNSLIKIPLPDEVTKIQNTINSNSTVKTIFNNAVFSFDDQLEKIVKSVNRSAESAAKEAKPIFVDAITGMSLTDGWDILNGKNPMDDGLKSTAFDSTAATGYFKAVTYSGLTNLYAPKINVALDKDLGLGFSATSAWTTLTKNYNDIVNSNNFITQAALSTVNLPGAIETDLGVFCTGKALDGLFYRVGKEEKKIRKNPFDWAIDILRKVFGS